MSISTPDSDVSDLLARIENLKRAIPQDEATRARLYDAARNLTFALESPGDSIQRIVYSPLQITLARIASDIKLFEILASKRDTPSSTADLAITTNTNETLLGRILRYLASFNMICENGEDLWSASNITKTLSIPGLKGGIYHNHDLMMPCFQELPRFLAGKNYQNPSDWRDTPFQKAHNIDIPAFLWIQHQPTHLNNISGWMTAGRESQNLFLDVFPFEKELALNTKPETPLFVDIGGSVGQQCALFKERLPHIPGRVILQDLAPVVSQAIPLEGVETMAHDFMTEQPVKGARAYYLRNIMHDYPDETCIEILHQIMKAMSQDSVILIDDMIIPNQGAHWQATSLDFTMMAGLAAIERTEKQWRFLLDSAGLKIKWICTYTRELRDSIIVAVLK